MYILDNDDRLLCQEIVDAAYKVHTHLGPGFREKIYETCFCHELGKKGILFERQAALPLIYDGLRFDEGLRLDVLVEESIICELKAVDQLNACWEAQVLSQLKLSGLHIGFLINFNVAIIKNGIRRYSME